MGVHSTLFGPVKYAILPQHLKPEELVGGNGLVEMGTFVAILAGTIAGGLVVGTGPNGPLWAGALAIAIAVAGWFASRAIPETPAVDPALAFAWNPFTETWRNLVFASRNRVVWLSMMGISWFWFYGAVFLAQFAGFARDHLGGNETVVTALLALFSVGVGTGSLLCERMSRRRVELGLVPFGSIGLTLFAVDLWFASRGLAASSIAGLDAFVANPAHWRVAADLVLIGVFGGFYIVPLYALIQERSEPSHRSRIIAANNILNAVFMVVAALAAILLLKAGLSMPELFLVTGLMNAAVALFIYLLLPEFLMRFLAWLLINAVYHMRTEGLENVPDEGPCVVVCNHVSYVDAVAIAACVRRPVRFVMDHRIFATPVLSFLFRTMGAIPIASARDDPALKERAFAQAADVLVRGEVLGIFPEGRLTPDGELGTFRPGLTEILERTPAPVVPMALRGLWGSFFSRSANGKAMRRLRGFFSRITLAAGPPIAPRDATPERLKDEVLALRGGQR
jgi:1-acyl-sn-glycerol-3-phosphate acyltransferase